MCESAQCLQCFPCQFCLLEIDLKKTPFFNNQDCPKAQAPEKKLLCSIVLPGKTLWYFKEASELAWNMNFSMGTTSHTHFLGGLKIYCIAKSMVSSNGAKNLGVYTYETPLFYPSKASMQEMDKSWPWASCCPTACAHLSRALYLHPLQPHHLAAAPCEPWTWTKVHRS